MRIFTKRTIRRGEKIRVLVVDDSVVIRRLVAHALEEEPSIEVVGSAPNGSIALQRIPQLNPDVITLDIEMPEMDGLEMLRQMRGKFPDVRVIMFSTLTERGAAATFEALSLGAEDYVSKASNEGSLDRSMISLRSELIPKIRQFFLFEGADAASRPAPASTSQGPPRVELAGSGTPAAVVIGVSTGGPNALMTMLPMFAAEFPLPVLIVQHMPPVFTRLLAERLNSISRLRVEEAAEGSTIEPGKVLIAPGNFHMRISKTAAKPVIALDQGPPENSCRPAVDVLFRSAEEAFAARVIAVVLTGMGYDGLRGSQVLKAHGARVIAQDEPTSVVWGMPGAVVSAGLADAIVPLRGVVPEIVKLAAHSAYAPLALR